MAFLDELKAANSQNFLGGLVKIGEAEQKLKQNQQLTSLWDQFQLKKKELTPTTQQVYEFESENKEGINATKQPTDPAVNMYKSLDRIGGMMNLYDPYIAAFSTLGEDGVKIANRLSQELANKVQLEEARGNVDFRALQMKEMQQSYDMNKFKFNQMIETADRNEDIYKMADYIASNPLFDQIESGNINTWKTSKLTAFTAAQNAVLEDVYKQFGTDNKGAALEAFKMAMNMTGKSFTFEELTPAQANAGKKDPLVSQMDISNALSFMQTATSEWENMSNEMRIDVKKLMRGEAAPGLKDKYSKLELDLLERMAETFRPGGTYNKNRMLIQMLDPSFGKVKKDYLTHKDAQGNEQKSSQMYTMPVNSMYADIMIPSGLSGVEDGLYEYMPYNIRQQKKLLEDKIAGLTSGSLLDESKQPLPATMGVYDQLRKISTESAKFLTPADKTQNLIRTAH